MSVTKVDTPVDWRASLARKTAASIYEKRYRRFTYILALILPVLDGVKLTLVGQISVAELLIITIFPHVLLRFSGRPAGALLKWYWTLGAVYLVAQIAIDLAYQADYQDFARSWAALGVLLLAITLFSAVGREDWRFCFCIVLGNSLGLIVRVAAGQEIVGGPQNFHTSPWRLGLGIAVTLIPLLFADVVRGPRAVLLTAAVMALGVLHFFMEARALGAITLLTSCLIIYRRFRLRRGDMPLRPSTIVAAALMAGVFGWIISGLYTWAAGGGLLGESARAKYEMEASAPEGLLSASRTDFFVALRAVMERPLFGYSSTQTDDEARAYTYEWMRLKLRMGIDPGEDMLDISKIPSHSHILSAWTNAGIFGAAFWMMTLTALVLTLLRAIQCDHPLASVTMFYCLQYLWAIPFSPGPMRLDFAIVVALMGLFLGQRKRHWTVPARRIRPSAPVKRVETAQFEPHFGQVRSASVHGE